MVGLCITIEYKTKLGTFTMIEWLRYPLTVHHTNNYVYNMGAYQLYPNLMLMTLFRCFRGVFDLKMCKNLRNKEKSCPWERKSRVKWGYFETIWYTI